MEVSDIANVATIMAQTQLRQAVGVTMLKKAMDAQASTVLALLQTAVPVHSAANLSAHLGQNVNTTA